MNSSIFSHIILFHHILYKSAFLIIIIEILLYLYKQNNIKEKKLQMFFSGIDSQLMSKSNEPFKQPKNKIFIN